MSSGRMRRVDEAIRQVIGDAVAKEMKDPRVGFVTVTDVRTSPDLSHARVYVSVLGERGRGPSPSSARPASRACAARTASCRAASPQSCASSARRRSSSPTTTRPTARCASRSCSTRSAHVDEPTTQVAARAPASCVLASGSARTRTSRSPRTSIPTATRSARWSRCRSCSTALGKDSVHVHLAERPAAARRSTSFRRSTASIHAPPADIAQRTVVFLDCGNIDRNSADVLRDGARLLNIDHHHDNTRFGTVNHVVARRLLHRGDRLGSDARPRRRARLPSPRGAVRRADHRHRALHVREHRPARARDGGRADRRAASTSPPIYHALYEDMPPEKLALMTLALGQLQRFDGGELTLTRADRRGLRAAPTPKSTTPRASSTSCGRCRARRSPCSCARCSSGERRGQRKVSLRATDEDVDVSLIARAQGAAATGAPPASPPRLTSTS